MAQSLFFGFRDKRLYGVYHPSERQHPEPLAVVLCPPLGQEAIRSHRALRVLAEILARRGFPALRFDYFATGDSAGAGAEGTLAQWEADVGTALEEIGGRTGLSRFGLVGLRLGAAVAARAAQARRDIEALVLWDPVVSGADYLREIRAQHTRWLDGSFARAKPSRDAPEEILGFPLGASLRAELDALDLTDLANKPAPRVLLFHGAPASREARRGEGLRKRLEALGALADEQGGGDDQPVWVKGGDEFGESLVPRPSLEAFARWLEDG